MGRGLQLGLEFLVAADVIRTVGDPVDGKCALQDGTQVSMY